MRWPTPTVLLVILLGLTAGPARADNDPHGTSVGSSGQAFTVGVTQHYGASTAPASTGSAPQPPAPAPVKDVPAVALGDVSPAVDVIELGSVLYDDFCAGTNWTGSCVPQAPVTSSLPATGPLAALPVAAVAAPPQVTPGMVAEAFRRVDLPASQLLVQPPNGRTLVNFATNFYTEQGSFTRVVTLLGQRVELRIHPDRFGWRFGDGHESWTTTPGAAYPDLQVTHDYQRKGVVHPNVDTAYAATFSVNGGAWQPVDGTVTIPGPPVDLEVVTATPRLIGGP